jgi:hypothetical protein
LISWSVAPRSYFFWAGDGGLAKAIPATKIAAETSILLLLTVIIPVWFARWSSKDPPFPKPGKSENPERLALEPKP